MLELVTASSRCTSAQRTLSTPPQMPQLLTDTDSLRLVPIVATCSVLYIKYIILYYYYCYILCIFIRLLYIIYKYSEVPIVATCSVTHVTHCTGQLQCTSIQGAEEVKSLTGNQ